MSTTTSTETHPHATHRITWHGDSATFHCDGDQDSACRNYPDCECESWTPGEHEHPDIPQAECLILPWLENTDPEDTYIGGRGRDLPYRDGQIMTEYDDEALWWEYAEPVDDLPQTEQFDLTETEETEGGVIAFVPGDVYLDTSDGTFHRHDGTCHEHHAETAASLTTLRTVPISDLTEMAL